MDLSLCVLAALYLLRDANHIPWPRARSISTATGVVFCSCDCGDRDLSLS